MANISIAKQAALRAAGIQPLAKKEYKITDPHFIPDMRGQFGGVSVSRRGQDQIVLMTEVQAKFYIDSGALTPVV